MPSLRKQQQQRRKQQIAESNRQARLERDAMREQASETQAMAPYQAPQPQQNGMRVQPGREAGYMPNAPAHLRQRGGAGGLKINADARPERRAQISSNLRGGGQVRGDNGMRMVVNARGIEQQTNPQHGAVSVGRETSTNLSRAGGGARGGAAGGPGGVRTNLGGSPVGRPRQGPGGTRSNLDGAAAANPHMGRGLVVEPGRGAPTHGHDQHAQRRAPQQQPQRETPQRELPEGFGVGSMTAGLGAPRQAQPVAPQPAPRSAPPADWLGEPEPEPQPQAAPQVAPQAAPQAAVAEPEPAAREDDDRLRVGFIGAQIGVTSRDREAMTMISAVKHEAIDFYAIASVDPGFVAPYNELQSGAISLAFGPDGAARVVEECDLVLTWGELPQIPALQAEHVVSLETVRHKLPPTVNPERVQQFNSEEEIFESLRIEPEHQKRRFVTFIGELNLYNNPFSLVNAVEGMEDVHLLFVGEGDAIPELAQHANRKMRGRVTFAGARADVGNILAISDVLVVPSIRNVRGFTVVEAWSAGVPVVASSRVKVAADHEDAAWLAQVPDDIDAKMAPLPQTLARGNGSLATYTESLSAAIESALEGDDSKVEAGKRLAAETYSYDNYSKAAAELLITP